MRAVIQRVGKASVVIDDKLFSKIEKGLLIFLAIEDNDTDEDITWLAGKISNLRIFNDSEGIMNLSVMNVNGEVMVISQFTLYAATRKGNRPSYSRSSKPETALPLYEKFIETFEKISDIPVKQGKFGAMMKIELLNDGPVTIIIDTKLKE